MTAIKPSAPSRSPPPPEQATVERLTVERLDGGEVSPYLTESFASATSSSCGAVHELLRLAQRGRRPAAADRRRVRTRAAHGDAPPSRRQLEQGRGTRCSSRLARSMTRCIATSSGNSPRRAVRPLHVHQIRPERRTRAADRRGDRQDGRSPLHGGRGSWSAVQTAFVEQRPTARPTRSRAGCHPHRRFGPTG